MAQQRLLAKEEYTVGGVCALPLELVAARHMLDEIHAPVQEQDASDHNSYVLGCVSQHNVVVAALPAGVYGTNPAATVAKDMLRTFPSVRFGLLVGIGGAAPSAFHDIRLGDVVVSRPSTTNGGVIQYDRGKLIQQGIFTRTGSLNSPPTLLLTTMSNLESLHAGTNSRILPFIEDMFNRFPKLRTQYASPGMAHDRLYQADYQHLANNLTCDACDSRREVFREPREDDGPEIHYGSIASSNQVVKDAVIRDRLRDELDVLCFEMEAAGLMQDFPCLVIRGICDYADSHKNKRWQNYAAAVAAAYVKEFLSIIPAARVQQESLVTELKDTLTQYTKDVRQHHHAQAMHNLHQEAHNLRLETHYQTDKHQQCHRIFKTSNYEEHKNVNPDRVEGTCRWVLDHPKFNDWKDCPNSDLLWISADPGCGKSVLAKSLIDHDLKVVQPKSGFSLCYFFFKDNAIQDNLATALCAVLHQLFAQQPSLICHAIPVWELTGKHLKNEVDALWRILEDVAADPETKSLICVLDALDECRDADRARLVKKLCDIYKTADRRADIQGSLKFLVTSRAYDSIQDGFQAIPESISSIRLRGEDENDQIHQEINLVIRKGVTEMANDLRLDVLTKQRIEKTLLGMEHRTYLWLHLTIGEIRTRFRSSLRPSQTSILLLPASVEQAYDQILQRVISEQVQTVKKIFSIILGAQWALTIAEMAVALDIALESCTPKRLSDLSIDKDHLERNIRQWCGLFVFINHSRIYLIHQTAKEFLLQTDNVSPVRNSGWKHCLNPAATHGMMFRVCAGVLLLADLKEHPKVISSAIPVLAMCPMKYESITSLLMYCLRDWLGHLQMSNGLSDGSFTEIVSMLYSAESMQWLFPFFKDLAGNAGSPPHMNEIHLAAYNGHDTILRLYISKGRPDLEAKDSHGWTALAWAVRRGHTEAVRILIDAGASIDTQCGSYGNVLQVASGEGHEQIVRLLIEKGADVDVQGGEGGNALQAACYARHERIAQLLIDHGSNVNIQGGMYGNALQTASHWGVERLVRLLIEKGANVNAQGGRYGNALQAASYRGHVEIVRVLIENGADINAQGGRYHNALEASLDAKNEGIAQLLVELGSHRTGYVDGGRDLFYSAVYYGCPAVVNQLIKLGVHPDVKTEGGKTLLYLAALSGHLDMINRLLELGANLRGVSEEGFTALHGAVEEGHLDMVNRLLELGADPMAASKEGVTPLHIAARKYVNIFDPLIAQGADINAQDFFGSTALHHCFYYGSRDGIHLLMQRGANPDVIDGYGRTCLDWSLTHPDLVCKFEELGYLYHPTPTTTRIKRLFQSILQLTSMIKDQPSWYVLSSKCYILGRILLFFMQKKTAITTLRLEIRRDRSSGHLCHTVECSMCQARPIYSGCYVCMQCTHVDLCFGCFTKYRDGKKRLSLCHGHDFVKVPLVPLDKEYACDTTKLTEKIKVWLQRLEDMAMKALEDMDTARCEDPGWRWWALKSYMEIGIYGF